MKRIVVRLSGMPFDPTYDRRRRRYRRPRKLPRRQLSFITDGETGTVIALIARTVPCKRITRAT
jgi:hypothetical protein